MKKSILYAILLLLAQPLLATSIVVFITPQYILLAADSCRTILNKDAEVVQKQTVRKIQKSGGYCYAIAGLVASQPTGFSADSIVRTHLATTTDGTQAAQKITEGIKEALCREISYQKKHLPMSYQKTLASKDHILEIVILSVHNGAPQAKIIGFELADAENIIVSAYSSSCPGDCPPQKGQFYFLGDYAGMEQYLGSKPNTANPVTLIEQLIIEQAKVTPGTVAAPVSMVRFSAAGIEWLK